MREADKKIIDEASPWYYAALGCAIVAAGFCVVVGVMLIVNQSHIKVTDPARAAVLELLKEDFSVNPGNEANLSNIRAIDTELRKDRIRRQGFLKYGTYILIGGVLVFCVCVKWALAFTKQLPMPAQVGDKRAVQVRQVRLGRFAMFAGFAVLVVCAIGLGLWRGVDIDDVAEIDESFPSPEDIAANWGSFRGPDGSGISPYTNVPTKWDGATGEGILWKSEVSLPGYGSPVVWGDRVFVSGADIYERKVYCFDAGSGEILWEKAVVNPGAEGDIDVMEDTGLAACTVVTDGRRVCAIFANGDLACFDYDGNRLWGKFLGVPESAYGYASSLAMYQDKLIIQFDQAMEEDGKSSLIAIESFSGKVLWQTKRDVPESWTSPIVTCIDGRDVIVTCADPWAIVYDAATGAKIWRVDCLGVDMAPSPIYAAGYIFAIEPYTQLVAIRPGGTGDVTETHIAWTGDDGIPDISSPVSDGEFIYLVTTEGDLTCYEIADGKMLWQEYFGGEFQASPVIANGLLYILNADGVMIIAKGGREFKEITRCELGESCYASPAFADGRIYIRGHDNLYCVGSK